MSPQFYLIAVVAVTIVAVSRVTRLLTFDKFPPVRAVRDWYERRTEDSGWVWLALCGYCMAPWVAAATIGTGVWAGVYTYTPVFNGWFLVWWIGAGWLAVSYLAAILMAFDGDKTEA